MSSAPRNMSTVSLISQTSSQRDINILTQCLNRHKESFETACDRILEHWLSVKRPARPSVAPDTELPSSGAATTTSLPSSRRLEDEARSFLAQRLVSLLSSMILPNIPQTISDVDARLCGTLVELPGRLLPSETELESLRVMAEKNRKKGLHLPVDKIFSAVREFSGRFNYSVCIYIAAVAEKIIMKWLDLAIRFEEKAQIENVIRASAFQNIFFICRDRIKAPKENAMRRISQFFPQDYDRCVDELLNLVSSSVEQLNLILRIFREPLLPLIGDHQTATAVEVKVVGNETDESDLSIAAEVFGGIVDFYHNFRFLLDCLETDSVEDYSSASGRTQATPPQSLHAMTTSPLRPPSAQSYFSNFSNFNSSWPAHEHRRVQQQQQPSSTSSFSLSSSVAGSSTFLTTFNCTNDGQSQCGGRQSRLVGPLLSGPAEDICLGPFMQYLDTVLDQDCFSVLWSLSERPEVIEALGRLSRTVIHTVSKLKPTYVAATSTNNSVGPELGPDPSWLFLHSFLCPLCRSLEQSAAPRSPTGSSDWNLVNDQNPSSQRPETGTSSSQSSRSACNFLINCFRYLLPRLVLLPIFQFYCLCGIVWALRENTQDQDDKDFLTDFRGMLTKIRVRLESDLSRRTGLHLQLARLISTGHVGSVPRSVNLPPLPASSFRGRSSSTSPLLGALATGQSRATINTTSADCSASALLLSGSCPWDINHIFRAAGVMLVGEGSLLNMSPTTSTTSTMTCDNRETQARTASSLLGGTVLAMGLAKVEEIERLTGGKERLAGSPALGNFVMEGRLLAREESMKNASERHVYLFTNCMLMCKRTERRSTLAPSSAPSALRIKRRLPLDLIHVIDCASPIPPSPQIYTFCDGSPESVYFNSSESSHQNPARSQGGLSWTNSIRSSSTAHLHPATEHNSFCVEFVEVRHVPSSSTSNTPAGATAVASALEPGAMTSPSLGPNDTEGCTLTGNTLTGPAEAAVEPSLPPGANIQRIWFEASSPEEKADWMASLLSIQTSRIFDLYLRTLPKLEIPLRLPTPDKYKFARPDTPNVIVFEHPSLTPCVRSPNPTGAQPTMVGYTDDLLEDDLADLGLTDEEDMFALPDELLQEAEQLAPSTSSQTDETASTVTDTSLVPTPLSTATTIATSRATTPVPASTTAATVVLSPSFSCRPALPQIRFATIEKLVERLTYPTYFDAAGVNAFLLSYRRYLTPEQLLNLLIERFNVPDPTFEPQEFEVDRLRGKLESPAGHMLRRFRLGYKFRVQSRVMMFLSRWVRSPRLFEIDFAPNRDLCARLTEFLSEVTTCHLLHTARAIEQWISHAEFSLYPSVDVSPSVSRETLRPPDEPGKPCAGGHLHESPTNSSSASSPVSLVSRNGALFDGPDHIDLLQIHPTELAEQVTLHEWDLYRRINFLEVVGGEHTPDKTPNLHACKDFSNKFHRWLVYSVLSERNAEDRTLAIQRVLDLMLIFEHFQNQQGFQEAKASLVSSGVFRLKKSFQTIRRNRHYRDVVDRVQSTGPSRKSRRTPSATGLLGVLHVSSSSSGSSGGCSSSSSKLIAFPSSGSAVTTAAATDGGDDCIRGCTPLASGNYSHLDQTTGSVASRQRRQPGRRNPPHHYPQQNSSSPGVPFFALNIITRLIHLELHLPDRVSPDGETLVNFAKCRSRCDIVEKFLCHQRHPYPFKPDPHIQQSLSHLHPFALPEISSTEDFEHRMFKLSKGYEPGESGVPPAAVERRLSKEAIQAANSLASQTIAQKLTPASVRAFKVLCGQVQYPSGTATAVGSANAFIKLDRISPRVSSPVHGALTTSPPSGEPSSPVSVVNSLWQTRLAQHRENQAHGGQKCQSPAPARPASSPTVSVAHQHSQSDSQVQTYSSSSDDRFSFPLLVDKRFGDDRSASLPIDACETPPSNTLPNRGHFNSRRNDSPYQRPPPLPPRRRSATRSTAASSNPTPVCIQQEAPTATRLPVTAVLEGEDDADLPPLPPKSVGTSTAFQRARPLTREQTTSSPVSPLFSNPSRQAELFASHQLLFGGEGTVDCRPPPLPPRRHVSGPAASNVLLQPTVRLP